MTDSSGSLPIHPPAGRSAPYRILWRLVVLVVNARRVEVPSVQVAQVTPAAPVRPRPVAIQNPNASPAPMAVAEALIEPEALADVALERPSGEPEPETGPAPEPEPKPILTAEPTAISQADTDNPGAEEPTPHAREPAPPNLHTPWLFPAPSSSNTT